MEKEGEYAIDRFPDGTIQWAFANTNPGWSWTNTGYVAPLGQWTHIAVVYDNAGGTIKTYANGSLVHTFTGSLGTIGDALVDDDLRIGGRNANSQYFQGQIDEMTIYNRALTLSEVQQVAGGIGTYYASGGTTAVNGTLVAGDTRQRRAAGRSAARGQWLARCRTPVPAPCPRSQRALHLAS